jgi:preprotein translocase subunit SecA
MQTQISDDSPLESEFIEKFRFRSGTCGRKSLSTTKNLFDYDDVLNKQRNIVYHEDKFWSVLIQNIFAYGEQIITEILLEFKEKIIQQTSNFI